MTSLGRHCDRIMKSTWRVRSSNANKLKSTIWRRDIISLWYFWIYLSLFHLYVADALDISWNVNPLTLDTRFIIQLGKIVAVFFWWTQNQSKLFPRKIRRYSQSWKPSRFSIALFIYIFIFVTTISISEYRRRVLELCWNYLFAHWMADNT